MEDKSKIKIFVSILIIGFIIFLIINNRSKTLMFENLIETKKQNSLLVSIINEIKEKEKLKQKSIWEKILSKSGVRD